MLTVYNVGQGDSFLFKSLHQKCDFNIVPLLIDTGPANAKVFNRIPDEWLSVLITHSHEDHLGGLPGVLRSKKINSLILPRYLPEIVNIKKYLSGRLTSKVSIPDWRKLRKLKCQFVSDGDLLCKHIKILNPPQHPSDFDFGNYNKEGRIALALRHLTEMGIELPIKDIVNYRTPLPTIQNGDDYGDEYDNNAKVFIHHFFISLSNLLRSKPRESLNYYINSHFELTSNQVSIVFKYEHPDGDWLFTGDADISVFDRLMKRKENISAKYLKVPHHGSRENLSKNILESIKPEYAIISHNNRRFGRSRDAHPHYEIIDMLDRQNITCFYTNAVIKGKIIIKPETTGAAISGILSFG